MKLHTTLFALLSLASCQPAHSWHNAESGTISSAAIYDDHKSLGPARDAECDTAALALLASGPGTYRVKTWDKNHIWVGKQIPSGGFVGPYPSSGFYTAPLTLRTIHRP